MSTKIETQNLCSWYGKFQVLKDVSIKIAAQSITAIIGPSGCGKSTFLRALNRLNDEVYGSKVKGQILLDGVNIYGGQIAVADLRRRVGMVFQRPNPFPASIFDNIAFGPRIHHLFAPKELEDHIIECLNAVGLQDLQDHLQDNALKLPLDKQQRLCIARAIATKPEILLLDEPCSTLDPQATQEIEDLIIMLKQNLTIVMVTHNMQQAARVSDFTSFLHLGELIEFASTKQLFTNPQHMMTENYISGQFG